MEVSQIHYIRNLIVYFSASPDFHPPSPNTFRKCSDQSSAIFGI